jgi:hypothetical protein
MKSQPSPAKGGHGREPVRPVSSQFNLPPTPGEPRPVRAAKPRIKVKPTHPAAPGKYQALQPVTTVEARIDVGFGNALFIRGQGDGLSWEKGLPLSCVEPSCWIWSSEHARGQVTFRLLLNDERWAEGEDLRVDAGRSIEVAPAFA